MERENWPVTFSIGVHASHAQEQEQSDPGKILSKADMAMYAAKKNGKNQIVVF
jgi:diguanylate cyclase (GGDEF)-like protein